MILNYRFNDMHNKLNMAGEGEFWGQARPKSNLTGRNSIVPNIWGPTYVHTIWPTAAKFCEVTREREGRFLEASLRHKTLGRPGLKLLHNEQIW